MQKNLHKAIMLGAAWGIVEATLGHILHLLPFSLGWFFWFPIAYFFIHASFQCTRSIPAAMLSASIAASLKFVDLLFTTRLDIVINPAVSIVLEAIAVMTVYKCVVTQDDSKTNALSILLSAVLYRSLYMTYAIQLPVSFTVTSYTSMDYFLNYMFFNNIVNTVFITSGLYAAKKFNVQFSKASDRFDMFMNRNRILKPALSAASVALAIAIKAAIR